MKDAKDVEVLKGEGGKERQGEVVELKVEEKLEEETKEEKKQEENEMETQGGELKEGEEIEEVIGRRQEVETLDPHGELLAAMLNNSCFHADPKLKARAAASGPETMIRKWFVIAYFYYIID